MDTSLNTSITTMDKEIVDWLTDFSKKNNLLIEKRVPKRKGRHL